MAQITFDHPHAGGLFARVSSLVEAWQRWRRYRLTVQELNALSDAELHDIGLHRSGIDRIARESVYRR